MSFAAPASILRGSRSFVAPGFGTGSSRVDIYLAKLSVEIAGTFSVVTTAENRTLCYGSLRQRNLSRLYALPSTHLPRRRETPPRLILVLDKAARRKSSRPTPGRHRHDQPITRSKSNPYASCSLTVPPDLTIRTRKGWKRLHAPLTKWSRCFQTWRRELRRPCQQRHEVKTQRFPLAK